MQECRGRLLQSLNMLPISCTFYIYMFVVCFNSIWDVIIAAYVRMVREWWDCMYKKENNMRRHIVLFWAHNHIIVYSDSTIEYTQHCNDQTELWKNKHIIFYTKTNTHHIAASKYRPESRCSQFVVLNHCICFDILKAAIIWE